ncbi:hypothetical protein [Paenibacillus residui]|uniref:Uncharacterized protein n=1 Tax=Paenibacillus residui TaxID=629724 RepID=A0ABW3D7L0_9BACL
MSDMVVHETHLDTIIIDLIGGGGRNLLNQSDYVLPWIAFIVGIHFIGLVGIFDDSAL